MLGVKGLHDETDFSFFAVSRGGFLSHHMVVHQQVNIEGQGRPKWRNAFIVGEKRVFDNALASGKFWVDQSRIKKPLYFSL